MWVFLSLSRLTHAQAQMKTGKEYSQTLIVVRGLLSLEKIFCIMITSPKKTYDINFFANINWYRSDKEHNNLV